jgi:hypothetical protein
MAVKNKLRVGSQTKYVIEVNDAGESIFFDLADSGLISRMFRMNEELDRITAKYEAEAKAIDARQNEPIIGLDDPDGNRVQLTKNQRDGAQLMEQFYKEARTALDAFLGEGACQKIFGSENYLTMFQDLLEQLEPHFKKMGLNMQQYKKTIAEKYKPNRAQRRALR